jgi:hypothetical protein
MPSPFNSQRNRTVFESTELQQIPSGRRVACKVIRPFRPGGDPQDREFFVGERVTLNPAVALALSQEGSVEVERKAGKIVTVADPNYVPPAPVQTARIRVRIASRHHPIGEPETRHCAVGEIITVKETQAVYACAGDNPSAERVE